MPDMNWGACNPRVPFYTTVPNHPIDTADETKANGNRVQQYRVQQYLTKIDKRTAKQQWHTRTPTIESQSTQPTKTKVNRIAYSSV